MDKRMNSGNMFFDGIQHPDPVNSIEGVPKVQFQDCFTRVSVLQVEPYCMNSCLCTSLHSETMLSWSLQVPYLLRNPDSSNICH